MGLLLEAAAITHSKTNRVVVNGYIDTILMVCRPFENCACACGRVDDPTTNHIRVLYIINSKRTKRQTRCGIRIDPQTCKRADVSRSYTSYRCIQHNTIIRYYYYYYVAANEEGLLPFALSKVKSGFETLSIIFCS